MDGLLKNEISNNIRDAVNSNQVLNNEFVRTFLFVATAAYAFYVAPKLPNFILDLFNYTIFKVLMMFLILATGTKNPALALMIAIAFWVSVSLATKIMDPEEMKNDKIERFLDSVIA